ncbi:VOC family protein [Taibaiella helva]|uniref:VOC family protein n=1 Tax=Taibaiella helva TaxID=2301235 RepID=UPI000E594AB6|nr:VOC family protein [Taibaiella helva]
MSNTRDTQTVTPYLILNGAARFIEFAREVFGAETELEERRPEEKARVMHAQLRIGNSTVMCADATEQWKAEAAGLFINVTDADTSFEKAQQAGATVIMPLSDQSYGRTCGVKDPAGVTWWITSPIAP